MLAVFHTQQFSKTVMVKLSKALKKMANGAFQQSVASYVPPQHQQLVLAAASAVSKQAKKKRSKKNKGASQSSNSNRPVSQAAMTGYVSSSESQKETTIVYNFSYITSLTEKDARARLFISPTMFSLVNHAVVSYDPRIYQDGQKYREFKCNRIKLSYPAGITSTATGITLMASSQDSSVELPEGPQYSYMQRNLKGPISVPCSLNGVVDSAWKPIELETSPLNMSATEKKALLAGVVDMQFAIDTATFAGIRVDVEISFSYRGRNPALTMTSSLYDFLLTTQRFSSFVPLKRFTGQAPARVIQETAAYIDFGLETGFNLIDILRQRDSTVTGDTVFDKNGVDVTTNRINLVRSLGFDPSTANSSYKVYSGDGTSLTLRDDCTTADGWVSNDRYLIFAKEGDYLRSAKTSLRTTGSSLFEYSSRQISTTNAVKMIRDYDPNFSESILPVV